jgi:hypothetical protein
MLARPGPPNISHEKKTKAGGALRLYSLDKLPDSIEIMQEFSNNRTHSFALLLFLIRNLLKMMSKPTNRTCA